MNAIVVERDGHIETWTLNLPDERNPISGPEVIGAFESCVDRVNGDMGVRVVILTGSGTAFSAGGDIKAIARGEPPFGGPPHLSRRGYQRGIQRIPLAFQECEVPIIAAVNGAAVGAGCDLALMCDIRIASTSAFFAESFVKLGIVPGDGGAWLLPRAVGHARAAEMALTGDRVDAATALEWGMVSRVVSPDRLLGEAMRLANRVAVNPPHAVRMTKRLLREASHGSLGSVLELSASMQALAHTTHDHREAVSAMMERRPAVFDGS